MTDYTLVSADAVWGIGQLLIFFAVGFAVGTKIKLIRKIEEMM